MFTLGCDVEHGLYFQGDLISAIGKIPGEKTNPFPLSNGGGLQVDNVLLEWNAPPATSLNEFIDNIQGTINEIKNRFPQYTLGYKSWYDYPKEELNDPFAWVIGCEPDYNAYQWMFAPKEDCINYKPSYGATKRRTAAGHIHTSTITDPVLSSKYLRLLDMYLGLPSLYLDDDRFRRNFYGKAGSFRTKEYSPGIVGVEYRTLGTFWVEKEEYIKWVYNTCSFIYNNLTELSEPVDGIESIINNYDIGSALNIIKEFNLWPV